MRSFLNVVAPARLSGFFYVCGIQQKDAAGRANLIKEKGLC